MSIEIVGLIRLFEEIDPRSFLVAALSRSKISILFPEEVAILGNVGVNARAKFGSEDLWVMRVTSGLWAEPMFKGLYLSLVQTNT